MAYLKPLVRPKCVKCSKRAASMRLMGSRNEDLGEYCVRCSGMALRRQQEFENRERSQSHDEATVR